MRLRLAFALSGLAALAQAAPEKPVAGRYALDAASCAARDHFLTWRANGFESRVFSCEGLAFVPRGEGAGRSLWQVDGAQCRGLHAGSAGPKRFAIEVSPGRLRLAWPDGTAASSFLLCP